MIEQLVTRIAATAGIDPAIAEKAVGMLLGFIQQQGDDGAVAQMIQQIPGAAGLVAQYNGAETQASGGGLLGSVMGAVGGMMGGGAGDLMQLGQGLMAEGLDMGQIQQVAGETLSFAKEHAGEDTVNQVIESVPGLSKFL